MDEENRKRNEMTTIVQVIKERSYAGGSVAGFQSPKEKRTVVS